MHPRRDFRELGWAGRRSSCRQAATGIIMERRMEVREGSGNLPGSQFTVATGGSRKCGRLVTDTKVWRWADRPGRKELRLSWGLTKRWNPQGVETGSRGGSPAEDFKSV